MTWVALFDVGGASRGDFYLEIWRRAKRNYPQITQITQIFLGSNSEFDVGGATRGDYVQDERYVAIEHMARIVPDNPLHFLRPWRSDVRRDCVNFAHGLKSIAAGRASHIHFSTPCR